MSVTKREWRAFEEAVGRFAAALNPAAEVLFDHRVPDRETGKPRQCDAWIITTVGGHWPVSIYVSCKDRSRSRRKLDQSDIDAFAGEILARGASMGVIYTNTGFTLPALDKALRKGIPCCKLYRREPADIPSAVWIKQFVCKPSIGVGVIRRPAELAGATWGGIFDIAPGGAGGKTVIAAIADVFLENEQKAFDAIKVTGGLPEDWQTEFALSGEGWDDRLVLRIWGHWKTYAARLEGILLDGSYSFANESFLGSVEGPWIDTQGAQPGPAWEEVKPGEVRSQSNKIVFTMFCVGVEDVLRSALAGLPLPVPEVRP